MPRVVLRSPNSVAKHQAQLVLLPMKHCVNRVWSECSRPLPFSLLVTSLEEEAGTTTCSPFVKLLSRCRCCFWLWLLPLGQPVYWWCFYGACLTSSTWIVGSWETGYRHLRTQRRWVWFLVREQNLSSPISHPTEAKACSPDWCIYKLENCGKPQPTNCEAHWVFALGFNVLPDINNNYVILTWLLSVHASGSTCACKWCCENALSLD